MIHTDVECAGDLSTIKLQSHQVARLGIMSQPEGHAQDHTSCKLQQQVQTVSSATVLALYYSENEYNKYEKDMHVKILI